MGASLRCLTVAVLSITVVIIGASIIISSINRVNGIIIISSIQHVSINSIISLVFACFLLLG